MTTTKPPSISESLQGAPKNWGRGGAEDQIGAINFLTAPEVLRGVQAVRSGKVFTLGLPMLNPGGDPVIAIRGQPKKFMSCDKGFFDNGHTEPLMGGIEWSDDAIFMYLQGTTHVDALGHVWYDNQMYNGFDAATSIGGLKRNSIRPIAEHGIVGRAVLLDIARYRGVAHLEANERISIDDLMGAGQKQGSAVRPHDILLVHTGWMKRFYAEGPSAFFGPGEPGISDDNEIIDWFHKTEIPLLGADTVACEQSNSTRSGVRIPLHGALLRNLGVPFNELLWLDDLAADCAADGQYEFLYVCAPLKVTGGTGSPVNPTVIK